MLLFSKSTNKVYKNISAIPRPWDTSRPSLYNFIQDNLNEEGRLPEKAQRLPDEDFIFSDNDPSLEFAAGALEGILDHHHEGEDKARAKEVFSTIKNLSTTLTEENFKVLYQILDKDFTLSYIDELAQLIAAEKYLNYERIYELALVLVTQAPDRGAIKFGMVIIGLFRNLNHTELFMLLGRHDEFTLYALIALYGPEKKDELNLWNLAKSVDGWGRIQAVERLLETENEEIKKWMLREGYKNSIMNEYLAFGCAVAGDLASALQKLEIDDELFHGASEVIKALLNNDGPTDNIYDYSDGELCIKEFLRHAENRTLTIAQLCIIDELKDFVEEDDEEGRLESEAAWSKGSCKSIADKARLILSNPEYKQLALSGLDSIDCFTFCNAARIAELFDVDVWEHRYKRQEAGTGSHWDALTRTTDPERIEKIISLAEKMMPLDDMIEKKGVDRLFGIDLQIHTALESILSALDNYPAGRGIKFIKAGLNSPLSYSIQKSLKLLEKWGQENWPVGTRDTLIALLDDEIDSESKQMLENLIQGKQKQL